MGVKAAKGPGHLAAGTNHRAIHVDGQSAQPQPLDLLLEQIAVEGNQRLEGILGELLEPVDHRALCRIPCQPKEPGHERIVGDVAQVFQAPATHHQQGDNQQDQAPAPVITSQPVRAKGPADPPWRSSNRK